MLKQDSFFQDNDVLTFWFFWMKNYDFQAHTEYTCNHIVKIKVCIRHLYSLTLYAAVSTVYDT